MYAMSTDVMRPTNSSEALRGLGMLQLLELDPRPTLVVDTAATGAADSSTPVYWNPALAAIDPQGLLDSLVRNGLRDDSATGGTGLCGTYACFQNWMLNSQASTGASSVHYSHTWTNVLVNNRWSVISGTAVQTATSMEKPIKSSSLENGLLKDSSRTKMSTYDWTVDPPPAKMSPHVTWTRSIDWANTPLGPMNGWSAQLRSVATLVMQDPRPAVVFWGPHLIMIYNEAYIELLGDFHPCLGDSARFALASIWLQYFEPIIEQNLAGQAVEKINTSIHMVRKGFMEETYFSLKFIPIFDSEGITVGHYETPVETTREVVAERRAQTLLQLSEEVPRARNSDSYWAQAIQVLSQNEKDILFALLYSVEADNGSDTSSNMTRFSDNHQECVLRGSFGLPEDCPAAPARLDFQQDHGFTPYFRQAMLACNPIRVGFDHGLPAANLIYGVDWQGFGDACRAAVVCPMNPTSSKDNILGFMVIGLNPRRPYDDDYRQFVMLANRLLSTSLSSILLHEEDIHRRERTIAHAESMKLDLTQQLSESQKKLERSVLKFQRFAERADIGIFIVDMAGVYSYRNEAWYHILSPDDREIKLEEAWGALIDDEYVGLGQAKFAALVETKQHQSFELRLKRNWTVPSSGIEGSDYEPQPMWILLSIFPELADDGEVLEIVGCFSDISQQKWGEELQAIQAGDARESKRRLENFIDTTSHEMRNPLSAIVQCADSIISVHKAFETSTDDQVAYRNVLDTIIDSAATIVQCSQHMKTIVDDVLTMSKLDSGLFIMTPVDVQMQSIARDAVKMFEGEAKAAGIGLEFHVEDSCNQSNIDYVSLDPTRVLQILINLITNAIKFTRPEKTREISVSLGISIGQPLHNSDGRVSFLRTQEAEESVNLQADWEKGEIVYIVFTVQDTGRGLSDAERELLFARFSQGSPRTHIDYGGSGLGLFISRRLTEMHGGAIGFASEAGVGSIFSFYIKCRKSKDAPHDIRATSPTNLSIRTQAYVLPHRFRDEKDRSPSIGRKPSEDKITTAQLHVLIVEDNLVNQRVLAKQLRNVGMKVAVANHGGEALEYIRTSQYYLAGDAAAEELSLVLMDWEMPVMDGLTCVREIRKLQKEGAVRGHVPVIAVTANVRSEQVSQALEAGMDDVISKPFRIPELCACIEKAIANTADM